MSDELFNIRFSEDGAAAVVQKMRQVVDTASDAAVATEKLQDQLTKTRNAANPAQAAFEKLAVSIDVLGRAQKANLISGQEQANLTKNLIAQTTSAVRPFSSLISSIQQETRAWGENAVSRQAAARTMTQTQALQRRGVVLSNEERESLARLNVANIQARDQFVASERAKREAIIQTAAAKRAESVQQAQTLRRDNIVGSVGPKVNAETEALTLNTVERQANLRTIQQAEALRATGITLSEQERASILEANTAYAQQREAIRVLADTERSLNTVRAQAGNRAANARSELEQKVGVTRNAAQIGLISPGEQAQLERGLNAAFNEQVNPLTRSNRLLQERAEYQRGLFSSGATLAQVEREITRVQEQGIPVLASQAAELRANAREVDRTEKAYRALSSAKGLLTNIFGGLLLAGGAGALAHGLDTTTNVRNLVGITATGPQNQQDVTKDVFQTAEATRSEVESTAKLYNRLELAAQRYGIGQRQVLTLTKEVNEQIRLSGTSEGEATRAVLDFAHSISAGNVQFRELRALTQQAPFVSVQIAKGLTALAREGTQQGQAFAARAKAAGVDTSKRDITVGDFKELTSKKALSSGNIIEAQSLEVDDTQQRFAKLQPTIAQAGTALKTFFLDYLDSANRATGAAGNIANGILFIGQHLKEIIPTALIIGSVLTGIFAVEKISEFTAILGVLATKAGIVGVTAKANASAIDGNTGALEKNSTFAAVNKKEIDGVTASLIRNTLARRGNAEAAVAGAGASAEGAGVGAVAAGAEGVAAKAGGFGAALAGGLGLAVPLILGAVTAYALLKDSINLASDQVIAFDGNQQTAIKGMITVGDVAQGVFDTIAGAFTKSSSDQKAASSDLTAVQSDEDKKRLASAQNSFKKTGDSYSQLKSGLVKGIVDVTSNFLVGAIFISQVFAETWTNMGLGFLKVVEVIANAFAGLYNNTIVPALNVAKSVGIGQGATPLKFDFTSKAIAGRDAQRQGDQRALANAITGLPNLLASKILGVAGRRQSAQRGTESDAPGTFDDPDGKKKKAKKDPFENEFDALLKKTVPAIEALRELNKQIALLANPKASILLGKTAAEINNFDNKTIDPATGRHVNIAETANGQITPTQLRQRILDTAQRDTLDAADPTRVFERNNSQKVSNLATQSTDPFNRSIAEAVLQEEIKEANAKKITIEQLSAETKLRITLSQQLVSEAEQRAKVRDALLASNQQQERERGQFAEATGLIQAQNEAYAIYKDQLLAGVPGAQAAYEAQTQVNAAFIRAKDAADGLKKEYEGIIAPVKSFADTAANLNGLLAQGAISLDKYNEKIRDANKTFLDTQKDGMSGFERGLLDVKKQSEDTVSDIEGTFKDAYNNVESGFEGLFTGGNLKQSAHKLFEGITNDLSKTLFHKLTDPLVSSAGKALGVAGFGDKAIQAQRADVTATNVYVNGASVNGQGSSSLTGVGGSGSLAANDNGVPSLSSIADGSFNPASSFTGSNITNLFGNGSGLGGLTPNLTGGAPSGGLDLSSLLGGGGASSLGGLPSLTGLGAGNGGAIPGLSGLSSLLSGGGASGGAAGGLSGLLGGSGGAGGLSSLLSGIPGIGSLLSGAGGGLSSLLGGGGSFLSSIGSFLPFLGFAGGGSFDVGGSGGTDSQVVSFKATPGENVSIGTPEHMRGSKSDAAPPKIENNTKIVNVMDPQASLDAMSTDAGFKVILNHVASNPQAIKRALGG